MGRNVGRPPDKHREYSPQARAASRLRWPDACVDTRAGGRFNRRLNHPPSFRVDMGELLNASETVVCRLRVNRDARECAVTPNTTLLEALRYGLGLPGSTQGGDRGDCGACRVVVEGEAILACISLALAYHDGPDITTIEGVAEGSRPH